MKMMSSAIVLLILLSSVGCSAGATTPLTTEEVVVPVAQAPIDVEVGGCIDPTDSMPKPVSQMAIDVTAATIKNWSPKVGDLSAGAVGSPGLHLILRKVLGGSSLDSAGEVRRVHIPGVPSVIEKPKTTNGNYIALMRAWREQAAAARSASLNARRDGASEALAVRQADWSTTSSEIAGCLEALARTTRGATRRFFVVSDLQQNDPAQVGLTRFHGAIMWIFHECIDAQRCRLQEQAWDEALRDRGASEVKFLAPELIPEALPAFLRGERS